MKPLFTIAIVFFILQAHATDWKENPEVTELFKNADVDGTFVLYDVAAQQFIGHNQARAKTRFIPASTFKIPHTLIGLYVGAVQSVDEALPYGGHPQPIKAWEKDMGLRDAIVISNVPIYQELARRIGLERMRKNILNLGFGNGEIGTNVDSFWLEGPLKVSAIEQTQFLAKLAQGELKLPQNLQNNVREITLIEQGENWTLHAKTGLKNASGQGIGWWVGWVQKRNRIYAFAMNMAIHKASDANKRIELGKASLKAFGIL